jgi:glycolate oxidase
MATTTGPTSAAAGAALLASIAAELPGTRLLTDASDRESYRNDETAYLATGLPLAVALPTTTAEVSTLVRLAAAHRVPVVPRGAGTGLSGGAVGIEGALTIAFTKMDRILEIDPDNLVAVVQPGVINADLKAAVAEQGLFYAPDPASYETCTIGGNVGTNAGGLCCVKYGVTREAVLALEVVLADGAVIRTGGRTVKDAAGYSLTQLFIGSQGTLGLVTEITLRLRPATPPKLTLLAFFPTLDAAGEAAAGITRAGISPVTFELMDQFTIIAVDEYQGLGLDRGAAAMLLLESVIRAADPQEADWLRQARRMAHWALDAYGVSRMEDVVVPRASVPAMLREIAGVAERHGVRIGTFGHVGDGNLHPSLVFDRNDPRAPEVTEAVRADLFRATLALGGSVTGEHGIGATKKAWLEPQRGADAVRVMRAIKDALDPLGILNPGKVL